MIKGRKEKEEQEYHHKRKEAHKIIRNKKKTYMKYVIQSIEDQKHNNTRKMYQTVNKFTKGYQYKFIIIRSKKGELAMNTKEKEIWKEYFDKLLNTEEPRELIKKGNKEISEVEVQVEELAIEDVKKAISNLKNNKAAGTDGMHLELIKYAGNKLLNRMYKLVRQILEEERIPKEWKETIIVPIHKRRD